MIHGLINILAVVIVLVTPKSSLQNTHTILSQEKYSLADRYQDASVNSVFSDNILLTLSYMGKKVKQGEPVSWEKVKAPSEYYIELLPNQTFAFHDQVLEKYQQGVAATTNAHFIASEGFKSDGWLVGDGVCHLASFMYAAAKEAGLLAEAPTNHDFATIADVPKELGVAIYYSPVDKTTSTLQNLYITNTRNKTIRFVFIHQGDTLSIRIEEAA